MPGIRRLPLLVCQAGPALADNRGTTHSGDVDHYFSGLSHNRWYLTRPERARRGPPVLAASKVGPFGPTPTRRMSQYVDASIRRALHRFTQASAARRITTDGVVTNYTDPTIDGPIDITAGPDGAMWFTNEGNNSIGRITTPLLPAQTITFGPLANKLFGSAPFTVSATAIVRTPRVVRFRPHPRSAR